MALKIKTPQPQDLLNKLKKAIDDKHIKTWRYFNQNGVDYFTHTTSDKQWEDKAFFKPTIGKDSQKDQLIFYIVKPATSNINKETYAIYHGRFVEPFLSHLEKNFEFIWATSLPESGDLVGTPSTSW
jgi:hypothetical protein